LENYVGEYQPKDEAWVFTVDDRPLFTYELEDVNQEIVEYFILKHKKIKKPFDSLSTQEQEELLEWFSEEVFPTEEFGNQMIKWMKNSLDGIKSEEELERLLKEPEGKITVDDIRIKIQDEEDEEEKKEIRKKVESLFLSMDKNSAEELFNGVVRKERWTQPVIKNAGLDIDIFDIRKVKEFIFPGYWSSLNRREL